MNKDKLLEKEEFNKVVGEIYKIINVTNNSLYIGQTRSHHLNRGKYRPFGYIGRFKDHISESKNSNKTGCRYLNSALLKNGSENFICELIMTCSIDELDSYEVKYISEFNTKFPLKIKYIENNKLIEKIIDIENGLVLKNEPILNVGNMILCMINYDNFLPNVDFMSIQELMHYFDCAYYLSLSGYKNFNDFFDFILEIFKKINFIKKLQKTLCLFHLIIKNLINLNYILKSSHSNNTILAKKFYSLVKIIKPNIKNILVHCLAVNQRSAAFICSFLMLYKNINLMCLTMKDNDTIRVLFES